MRVVWRRKSRNRRNLTAAFDVPFFSPPAPRLDILRRCHSGTDLPVRYWGRIRSLWWPPAGGPRAWTTPSSTPTVCTRVYRVFYRIFSSPYCCLHIVPSYFATQHFAETDWYRDRFVCTKKVLPEFWIILRKWLGPHFQANDMQITWTPFEWMSLESIDCFSFQQ